MRRNLPMILIRVIVGLVFLVEGILKFAHPDELGAPRFAGIGLPYPHLLAPLVGGVEIVGGVLIILDFFAGDAALVMLAVIVVALVTTKAPILLGRQFGPFTLIRLHSYGLLSFFHEARVDLCMLFGSLAVLIDSGLRVGRKRHWYQSRGLKE
jgi:putative oxidoreductase